MSNFSNIKKRLSASTTMPMGTGGDNAQFMMGSAAQHNHSHDHHHHADGSCCDHDHSHHEDDNTNPSGGCC